MTSAKHTKIKKNHNYKRQTLTLARKAYKLLCEGMIGIQPNFARPKSLKKIEKGTQLVDMIIFYELTNMRKE